jgi:hypothetical protein
MNSLDPEPSRHWGGAKKFRTCRFLVPYETTGFAAG